MLSLVYYSDCMVQHYVSQHRSPDNDFMRTCMHKDLPFALVLSVLTVAMCKSTKRSTWTVPCLLDVIALGRFVNLHKITQSNMQSIMQILVNFDIGYTYIRTCNGCSV